MLPLLTTGDVILVETLFLRVHGQSLALSCKADLSIRWQLVLHDHGTAEPGHFEKADEFWRLL